eukprot:COSAG01_NODE_9207_length_2519_cov_1.795041_3_plen_55_part_00
MARYCGKSLLLGRMPRWLAVIAAFAVVGGHSPPPPPTSGWLAQPLDCDLVPVWG